ncbi:MAG: flagellar hook-length control protein FliK [Planctomycetales bacterium]|nr:flagellar hook-length control protein FliK [Planctomycetales bacterium]
MPNFFLDPSPAPHSPPPVAPARGAAPEPQTPRRFDRHLERASESSRNVDSESANNDVSPATDAKTKPGDSETTPITAKEDQRTITANADESADGSKHDEQEQEAPTAVDLPIIKQADEPPALAPETQLDEVVISDAAARQGESSDNDPSPDASSSPAIKQSVTNEEVLVADEVKAVEHQETPTLEPPVGTEAEAEPADAESAASATEPEEADSADSSSKERRSDEENVATARPASQSDKQASRSESSDAFQTSQKATSVTAPEPGPRVPASQVAESADSSRRRGSDRKINSAEISSSVAPANTEPKTVDSSLHNGLVSRVVNVVADTAPRDSAADDESRAEPQDRAIEKVGSRGAEKQEDESLRPGGLRQAAGRLTGPRADGAPSDTLSVADRVRFVQRVGRAFQIASDRGGEVRLRLAPPELGQLHLELTVRDGTLTARLEVETHTARNILLDNMPALRERLGQQELKVGNIEVGIFDRSPGDSQQSAQRQDDPHEHFGRGPMRGRNEKEQETPTSEPRQIAPLAGGASELNIII